MAKDQQQAVVKSIIDVHQSLKLLSYDVTREAAAVFESCVSWQNYFLIKHFWDYR